MLCLAALMLTPLMSRRNVLQSATTTTTLAALGANSSFVGGARASVTRSFVRLATYPLDTWKTREQVGGGGNVFKGSGYAIVGAAPAGALLVSSYDALKAAGVPSAQASFAASITPLALKIPLEGLKQRAQVGTTNATFSYRGGLPHALRELGFNAIQLSVYDALDGPAWRRGAQAALVAAVATHPLDVLKTRAMTAAEEGDERRNATTPISFTAGLIPRSAHATIGGAAFFAAL